MARARECSLSITRTILLLYYLIYICLVAVFKQPSIFVHTSLYFWNALRTRAHLFVDIHWNTHLSLFTLPSTFGTLSAPELISLWTFIKTPISLCSTLTRSILHTSSIMKYVQLSILMWSYWLSESAWKLKEQGALVIQPDEHEARPIYTYVSCEMWI